MAITSACAEDSCNVCVCVLEVKATLVCPATAKHLEKYTQQEMFLVTETEQDYRDITLPFLLKSQFSLQVKKHQNRVDVYR